MVRFIYSPQWFYGKDIIIDIVSIFVLLLISLFSIRYYTIKKNRNYLFLALSFLILAGSFLFKVLMNFNIYYKVIETQELGLITVTYQTLKASNRLFSTTFLVYWLLTQFGYYSLFSIYQKQTLSNFLFGAYLIVVSTFLSYPKYYTFNLTLFVILGLITYTYSKNYINRKLFATKLIAFSFGVIALSQIFFILVDIDDQFYVIGELIQLVGYIGLLIAFIMVLRHGRKEISNRHNW